MQLRPMYQAARYCTPAKHEQNGPIFCDDTEDTDETKKAWLGPGYYFWDSVIADARWWGTLHYNDDYLIAIAHYNAWSNDYLDLTEVFQRNEFFEKYKKFCSKTKKELNMAQFIVILQKIGKSWKYKAVKCWPSPTNAPNVPQISFPNKDFVLYRTTRIQICVTDLSFLHEQKFEVIEEHKKEKVGYI